MLDFPTLVIQKRKGYKTHFDKKFTMALAAANASRAVRVNRRVLSAPGAWARAPRAPSARGLSTSLPLGLESARTAPRMASYERCRRADTGRVEAASSAGAMSPDGADNEEPNRPSPTWKQVAAFLNVFHWVASKLSPLLPLRRWRQMRAMACVAPIADIAVSYATRGDPSGFKLKLDMATVPIISSAIASFVKIYLLLLFLRVLLTWFPNFDWVGQPWNTLRQVTDPYLNIFRGIIPPLLGQIDFTPILGFIVLQFLSTVLDVQGGGGSEFPNSSQFPDDEVEWAEDVDVDEVLRLREWRRQDLEREASLSALGGEGI